MFWATKRDDRLQVGDWEGIRTAVLDGYRTREPGQGVLRAIEMTGALPTTDFPISPDDEPELPDEPHLGDGR